MVFTILISIVFVAELIIAGAVLSAIGRWGKKVRNLNSIVSYIKPSVREVAVLTRKISAQLLEFSEDFVYKIKHRLEDIIFEHAARIILTAFLVKRFKKSKLLKLAGKGLSLLEIVI